MMHSKDDEGRLIILKKRLHEKWNIPLSDIHIDTFVSMMPDGSGPVIWHGPVVSASEMRAGAIVHHPDIVCLRNGKPALIVELDGSFHDTVPGRRRTERRDRDYLRAHIPYIALNEADIRELGQEIEEALDDAFWDEVAAW